MKPTTRKSRTSSLETKKSLNLTNTERSQLHRSKIYKDSVLHVKQKEQDRIREAAKRLEEDSKDHHCRKGSVNLKRHFRKDYKKEEI